MVLSGVPVLHGVDLVVREGASAAVVGPSGSGKSTLLSTLLGLVRPSAGEVWIGDRCVSRMGRTELAQVRRHSVGMVFQDGELVPELEPVENVAMAALIAGVPAAEAWRRAADLLDELEVPPAGPRRGSFPAGSGSASRSRGRWRVVPGDPVTALGAAGDSGWRTALLVSPDGSDLPIAEVNADLSALSTPAPVVGRLSESWTWAANDGVDKAAWLTLFGAWAVALLSLALGGAGLAEQLDMARGVRAWAAMGAGARTIWGRTGWRMLTPLALAMVAGVAATVGLARPITAPGEGGSLPASTLLATCILAPLASLALWAAASSLAVRDLNVWSPDDDRRPVRGGSSAPGVDPPPRQRPAPRCLDGSS
ncbi:ATP-binding cassette domain-containing protein [Cellulomonas sp.]|uniref:ATP-binding cassette domain-containing protein n=1 Tax=Cellulomonas sp. TaxID=40001 RepID=UPI002584E4DB|nr:ATP-binding cassette domain-containing protein [Cellulomonas sp.]MCR6688093.1 ATP-binding cassette domain-containing protein [Cellulomonas sp.]